MRRRSDRLPVGASSDGSRLHHRDLPRTSIALETLDEVIVKKVRYRGGTFTSRDVFDLAAVGQSHAGIVAVLARETADVLPRLRAVIEATAAKRPMTGSEIIPMEAYMDLVRKAYGWTLDLVRAAIDIGVRTPEVDG